MGLRKLNHEILNEVDIKYLLTRFSKTEIALFFKVPLSYVDKCRGSQEIIKKIELEKTVFADVSEDELVCEDAWMKSKERDFMQRNFLLEAQNGKS